MAIKVYIQKRPSIVVQVGAKVINTGGGAVDSVNGQAGVVVLDASDVGAYPDTNPSNYVDSAGAAAAAPIQSVTGTAVGGTPADPVIDLQDLSYLQEKSIVVAGNTNAVNDGNYTNVANATYTDPSPVEGKVFRVLVRNGTATVGGTGYSTAGTVIIRIFHSGSWANYVYQVSGGASSPEILYCAPAPITITGLTAETLLAAVPIPTDIGNGWLRITYFQQIQTFAGAASCRIRVGTIENPSLAQIQASQQLATNAAGSSTGIDIFREFPIVGGASGNIKAAGQASNIRSDEATPGLLVTYNVDWTTQHYIYFTATPSNTGNVLISSGILVECIK